MRPDLAQNFKRILWYVFFATKGGINRISIVEKLEERPYNMNQLSKELSLDYKTVMHHIKVLMDNKIIVPEEKKYGTIYFPSQMFEQCRDMFGEIKSKFPAKRNGKHA
jgi:predicted transcriptional regulator